MKETLSCYYDSKGGIQNRKSECDDTSKEWNPWWVKG